MSLKIGFRRLNQISWLIHETPETYETAKHRNKALPSNPNVFKSHFAHIAGFVDVSEVCDLGCLEQILDAFHIQRPELVPFRSNNKGVGVAYGLILICSKLDSAVKTMSSLLHRN